MSDDKLNSETNHEEDERLLQLLDAHDPHLVEGADRAWLETLGLLAYELDEVEARPEIKDELMSRVAAERFHSASGRLVALERRARWYMPIAATFAVALLGVAALQFWQLEVQRQTIDELSSQLERVEQGGSELASIRGRLDQQDDHLRMLTTRGAEFCVLRPVGEPPRFPSATATMVISPARNRWYLAVEGLGPCPASGCYQLWFVTEGEPIPAARFDSSSGEGRIELTGEHEGLPVTVRAITITLEVDSGSETPAETVLLADQAMTLL